MRDRSGCVHTWAVGHSGRIFPFHKLRLNSRGCFFPEERKNESRCGAAGSRSGSGLALELTLDHPLADAAWRDGVLPDRVRERGLPSMLRQGAGRRLDCEERHGNSMEGWALGGGDVSNTVLKRISQGG